MKKRMLLYFGSFDPIHNGHIALAEYALDKDLADQVALVISPQNPFKADVLQTPEYVRFEMAELACRESRYPQRILPSVVEESAFASMISAVASFARIIALSASWTLDAAVM